MTPEPTLTPRQWSVLTRLRGGVLNLPGGDTMVKAMRLIGPDVRVAASLVKLGLARRVARGFYAAVGK